MQISRRRFLALSATITVAACSSDDTSSQPSSGSDPSATTPASPPPTEPTVADTDPAKTPATSPVTDPAPTTPPSPTLSADPFVYGVASGDPDESSVVLWTRLASEVISEALDASTGQSVDISWNFVGDSGESVSGVAQSSADVGWSIHAIAEVSEPGQFSFSIGEWTSPVGRTAPLDPSASEVRIAAASCQNFETGFYAAHRDIADWSPDLVLFLGDFIYESAPVPVDGVVVVRAHENPEPFDADGYRARYGTYLLDQHLQASRAAAPWVAIWDDHEVQNNYAGTVPQVGSDPALFAARRTAGYQVWWENMPTRLERPSGDSFTIYRGVDIGDLVRISVLDGRQYPSDQVSDVILDLGPPAEGWDDPDRTMLGADQETWITERFATSDASWNCLAQQTILSDTRIGDAILNYDQWDGYAAGRERLLASAPANFVTITGDIHLAGVGRLGPIDAPVGIEFVTTSISSSANVDPALAPALLAIPSIFDAELFFRGYTRHTVTREMWTAEFRSVTDVADPDSDVTTWKTFGIAAGAPDVSEI